MKLSRLIYVIHALLGSASVWLFSQACAQAAGIKVTVFEPVYVHPLMIPLL